MSPPNHDEPWPWPIASHPGERDHTPRNHNILVNHWRNEPPRRGQLGHHLAFTKSAHEPDLTCKAPLVMGRAGMMAYRITLSAWKRSVGGMVSPRAWTVLRLMTSLRVMTGSTGSSPG